MITSAEEEGLVDVVPFFVEDELIKLSGDYAKVPDWQSYAVGDGLLITGQNSGSSAETAEGLSARFAA